MNNKSLCGMTWMDVYIYIYIWNFKPMSSETLLLLKLTLQQKHYINFFENQALYKYINIQCLLLFYLVNSENAQRD